MRSVLAFVRYCMVGGALSGLGIVVFLALSYSGLHYGPATVLTWIALFPVGYLWHKRFSFGLRRPHDARELGRYLAVALFQLVLAYAIYWLFLDVLKMELHLSVFLNSAICALASFTIAKVTVFHARRPAPAAEPGKPRG